MAAANGGASKVTDWSRLFLSPGMGHCAGGSATLDNFDLLTASVNWVEKGQAPESVMATGHGEPSRGGAVRCAHSPRTRNTTARAIQKMARITHAVSNRGRKTMKSIKVFGTLACALGLGQALIPAISAQAPAKAAGSDPAVSSRHQQARGSLTAVSVAVFKNIPFAQPPVGALRWREPLPAKAWTGVRDATTFGPMCNQNDNKQLPHSEDCLQLNVWTPK